MSRQTSTQQRPEQPLDEAYRDAAERRDRQQRREDFFQWEFTRDRARFKRLYDLTEGIKFLAFSVGLPVLHWYLIDSSLLYWLTLPLVGFVNLVYILYKGAETGPGGREPNYWSASSLSPAVIGVRFMRGLRRIFIRPPKG
ncbi:hypothetical protein [Neoroseomonas oryzicola]|uniref:Uncharacterized protein n=1 Tax=Neoroseomonas oryzicola TaxID=535904 RepID=A0A9X9WGX0_9PROT|nr:hypothetical protein [Neoroseomonas oryzicola]MBR0659580.1 hypothetical protein [Neoroseomonas oryzicola]NKE16141.1 hypothetical protein [Neoroseomonas oryzicola]